MTLENRISQFIGKALTRLRVLQLELIEDFDYQGYQNDNAEKLLLQISETYDCIDLLSSDYKGGLTEKEIRDLIDFFFWWLELNPVIAVNYANYQMPIQGSIIIPGGGGGGSYATVAALNAEIAARIAADQALSARIDELEEFDPSTIFPEGFFDNFTGDYTVVFDDDPRLHTHDNKVELDQINAPDLANIKALSAHFGSVGTPGGLHVSQADRDRWDAGTVPVDPPDPVPAEVYDLTSPSTIAVGGMPAGTTLTGRTWQSIIEEILVEYILPSFTSFAITDIPGVVEVGVSISGVHNFTWVTSNSFNVQPDTIAIRDVTSNTVIGSGLANDGSESLDIGVIPNTAPMSRSWRAEGKDTNNVSMMSGNDTVTSLYPYFFGKIASGGVAPGLSRPVANQALINSGTKVVASSAGVITINFNSTNDDYVWFAIPATSASKVAWFVNVLNNGAIGGAVNPGGNLFPDFDTVAVDSPTVLWNGVSYKIYVSNYQTAIAALMELRNA